ncbi:integrin alpha-X-like [Catharus ustulatus]|uniref:integrin alpha-X-like n=1 Tax=Catharus ustulatus TaxID=91951 RepID=UPI00140A2D37|nr:integrin alpha-X-like [Catharus ustulatus]
MEPRELLVLLGTALLCRALDLESPLVFRGDADAEFGASVAQFGSGADGWVLVGAPLARGPGANDSGSVFRCGLRSGECEQLQVRGPSGAVNSSLGLAMAAGDDSVLVCGPTCPRVCGANVHLSGFCVRLDTALRPQGSLPEKLPECPPLSMDIALLVDGSGSIVPRDFQTMLRFLAEVMRRFRGSDAQFSLVQYSYAFRVHFSFRDFRRSRDPVRLLAGVRQLTGTTRTASAIKFVLENMFVSSAGARPDARRILVVVTDGEKTDDRLEYSDVIPAAERMAVTRYAIGVGQAFSSPWAQQELDAIASAPPGEHVFRVDNFDALARIHTQLQEKIFAIEGTHSAHSSSFQLEMAQEGFSAALTPAGPVLGAVGAFDWSGGAFVYGGGGAATFVNGTHLGTPGAHLGDGEDARDAYLGYSAAVVPLGRTWGLALGAPRYAHLGRVLVLQPGSTWTVRAAANGTQVGSYFGASLLALQPCPGEPRPGEPRPGEALKLLVGAPLFYGGGSGGRVHLCELQGQSAHLSCALSLRGSPGQPLGRFGASLAHLGDLDGDRCAEVAVGAPLEDDGRGAVYLFRGAPGGLRAEGVQRIPGSAFPSQPRFFGRSLSGGRDLSGDHLPDLAVGARGQVLLLRSPPLLQVRLQVSFEPQVIPAAAVECPEGEELRAHLATAKICFQGKKITQDNYGPAVSLSLWFLAELDPGRAHGRADFGENSAQNGSVRVGEGRQCRSLEIRAKGCPRDTLTPLTLRVTLGGRGDPLPGGGGLRTRLGPGSDTAVTSLLPFEHDCGADNACEDELGLRLSTAGVLVVGEGDALELTLTLSNSGESSFGPGVLLEHPGALSFRKVQVLQDSRRSGSLLCHSEPPEGRGRRSLCQVQPPVLRRGGQVTFKLTLDVPPDAELGDILEVTANATSENGGSGGRSQSATIPVRYQVLLVLASAADSTRYLNVSMGGAAPAPTPVSHHYQVKVLGQRGLPANVTFLVPSRLGQEQLWEHLEVTPEQVTVTPGQEQPRCQEGPEHPGHAQDTPGAHLGQAQDSPAHLVCPGLTCREFRCSVPHLSPPRTWDFRVGGTLRLGWVGQLQQPKLHLFTSAQVSFDQRRYKNTWGSNELQVQTELEQVLTPNPLPLILGASLGGLLLLGLVALGLYKVGFFRRRYQEMLEGSETPGDAPGEPQEPPKSE